MAGRHTKVLASLLTFSLGSGQLRRRRVGHLCCIHERAVAPIGWLAALLSRAPPHHKASGSELARVDEHSSCQSGHKGDHDAHAPQRACCVAAGQRLLGGGIAVGVMQVQNPAMGGQ